MRKYLNGSGLKIAKRRRTLICKKSFAINTATLPTSSFSDQASPSLPPQIKEEGKPKNKENIIVKFFNFVKIIFNDKVTRFLLWVIDMIRYLGFKIGIMKKISSLLVTLGIKKVNNTNSNDQGMGYINTERMNEINKEIHKLTEERNNGNKSNEVENRLYKLREEYLKLDKIASNPSNNPPKDNNPPHDDGGGGDNGGGE